MTPAEASAYIRFKTKTNTTTFSNADLLTVFNVIKNDICQKALKVDEDIFLVPTTFDLVADQREYPLHSTILGGIKRVEAKLDGTNWVKLYHFDLLDYEEPVSLEADITAHFGNDEGQAFYDLIRRSIWVYSGTITAVTDGLKIWQNTYPANLTDMTSTTAMQTDPSTTTHGVPQELHSVICEGVIIDYKTSRDKPIALTEKELLHERHINEAIHTLKKGSTDEVVIGNLPTEHTSLGISGSNF